jgi:hypothetical protein
MPTIQQTGSGDKESERKMERNKKRARPKRKKECTKVRVGQRVRKS